MDPSSSGDLQKLREAIRHSQSELEPFRQQYRERLVQYAGDGYGDNRDAADTPFNVYNLALRIYKRRLFSGQMRVLVTSRSPSERRAAWELGLAGDDVIREINLDATFDKVLQQALGVSTSALYAPTFNTEGNQVSEKVRRDHKISFMWGLKDRVVKAGELTPMKAIRYKCIDCSGGSTHEVKRCVCTDCPLCPFRLRLSPFRRERQLTPDQRATIVERFAAGRSKPR